MHVERGLAIEDQAEAVDLFRALCASIYPDHQRKPAIAASCRRQQQRAAQWLPVDPVPADDTRMPQGVALELRVDVRHLPGSTAFRVEQPHVFQPLLIFGDVSDRAGGVSRIEVERGAI